MKSSLYQNISNYDRWLITLVVMAATLMQVIDITIINVALPYMQGSLDATPDEITWALTSYLIASAIFMPLTGYFADTFGRKRYFIVCISGFTIASALCGASVTLLEMVLFRMLQGIFGAALVPLSQAILADIFPPKDRGKAMAIWGMGVMVGPTLGPTLGGYLTEIASWRWTFYVNIPIGVFVLLLSDVIPGSVMHKRKIDWLGLLLLSSAIGCLQFVLDRGSVDDWFDSQTICVAFYICIGSFLCFFMHTLGRKNTIIDLSLFKDRNFSLACTLISAMGIGLYGTMVILPLMLEGLFDYPVFTTGLVMAPRGVAGMVGMLIVAKILNDHNARAIVTTGIILCCIGTFLMSEYAIAINTFWLSLPLILQGFGLGVIFVPLSTIAFSTIPGELRTEAAGLYSLLRTIGGSIGISVVATMFTHKTQVFWQQLGSQIHIFNPSVHEYLKSISADPESTLAVQLLGHQLSEQSQILGFINSFYFIACCFILMLPLTLLFKSAINKDTVVDKH